MQQVSRLAVIAIALLCLGGGLPRPAFAPPLPETERALDDEPTNCNEVIAYALRDESSLHWYKPRVYTALANVRSRTEADQRALLGVSLRAAVPNEAQRSVLVADSIRALAIANQSELCELQ